MGSILNSYNLLLCHFVFATFPTIPVYIAWYVAVNVCVYEWYFVWKMVSPIYCIDMTIYFKLHATLCITHDHLAVTWG